MQELIEIVAAGTELTPEQVREAAGKLVSEEVVPGTKAEFLRTLARKGETPAEMAAFVETFLDLAVSPRITPADVEGPMIDVCGTGGDRLEMFNVSTTSMFILAAAGVVVVKHGNRGITSRSGGADVLEALGIRIDMPPEEFADCVHDMGVGFLFAPHYHPAFKAVAPVRKQLAEEGQRTVFNILGPLLNPVRPDYQLVGVFSQELPAAFADILGRLKRKRAWAVHGKTEAGQGMDELSTLGANLVFETRNGTVTEVAVDTAELGLEPASLDELRGGDAAENAELVRGILSGEIAGPRGDIVLLNAAAGLVVAGLAQDMAAGLGMARELIRDGSAIAKLEALRSYHA